MSLTTVKSCTEKSIDDILVSPNDDLNIHINSNGNEVHGLGNASVKNVGIISDSIASGDHTHSNDMIYYYSNRSWSGSSIEMSDWMEVEFDISDSLRVGTYFVIGHAEVFLSKEDVANLSKDVYLQCSSDINLYRLKINIDDQGNETVVDKVLLQTRYVYKVQSGDRGGSTVSVQRFNFMLLDNITEEGLYMFLISSSVKNSNIVGGQLVLVKA
jgi:hypothetical protein